MLKDFHTPYYIYHKSLLILYQKLFPKRPWISRKSYNYLNKYLTKEMVALEFGSGRSTIWFASKLKHLTSVEHDEAWYENVQNQIKDAGISNVDYLLKKRDNPHDIVTSHKAYTDVTTQFEDNHFDFILVDGDARAICALNAVSKVKKGGILVVDNINRFIPNGSKSHDTLKSGEKYIDENWKKFDELMNSWKRIWTTNGVSDTAIFKRPVN